MEIEKATITQEGEKQAALKARERSRVARWDIDIAIFLFGILIVVIILLFQNIGIEIVSTIALLGLSMVWLIGWRRGSKLYKKFLVEELAALKSTPVVKTMEETIEEKVQKAFRDRIH